MSKLKNKPMNQADKISNRDFGITQELVRELFDYKDGNFYKEHHV